MEIFSKVISNEGLGLLEAKGTELVKRIGKDIIRNVVSDVLTGKNIRDSTEPMTRKRIAKMNLALLEMFLTMTKGESEKVAGLPILAAKILESKKVSKQETRLAQWILGLTNKGYQNVLRDDPESITGYVRKYNELCSEVVSEYENNRGKIEGILTFETKSETGVKSKLESIINLDFLLYLFNTIGAETLTVRGSEKSAHGKLFEKLILGSLLTILGFRLVSKENIGVPEKVFWLSDRSEKRESDATLLYEAGKGVRFDIGFIGRGNPEITLDKVSRFEREIELNSQQWYLATFIIVDTIGEKSSIEELARRIGGTIVQMSMSYWPRQIAAELERAIGYSHVITNYTDEEIENYIRREMSKVQIDKFI